MLAANAYTLWTFAGRYQHLTDGDLFVLGVGLVDQDGNQTGIATNPLVTDGSGAPRTVTTIADVSMAVANTEYSMVIPDGARDVALKLLNPSTAWRFSPTTGVVAGGGGFQLAAGETLVLTGTRATQTVYFASSSAGQTMTALRD